MIHYERMKHGRLLMYFGVIKRFMREKHDISEIDLEMLLFLYGIGTFKREDFDVFRQSLPFNSRRFNTLLDKGFIVVIKTRNPLIKKSRTVYDLSNKAEQICHYIYRQMFGNISMTEAIKTSKYNLNNEKIKQNKALNHQKAINKGLVKRMNEENKELRGSSDKVWLAKMGLI